MNTKPKRPRLVGMRVASYSTSQAMLKFKENLKAIRNNISDDVYITLQKCDTANEAVSTMKAFLDNKYVEELDWLYSTFFSTSVTRYVTV